MYLTGVPYCAKIINNKATPPQSFLTIKEFPTMLTALVSAAAVYAFVAGPLVVFNHHASKGRKQGDDLAWKNYYTDKL